MTYRQNSRRPDGRARCRMLLGDYQTDDPATPAPTPGRVARNVVVEHLQRMRHPCACVRRDVSLKTRTPATAPGTVTATHPREVISPSRNPSRPNERKLRRSLGVQRRSAATPIAPPPPRLVRRCRAVDVRRKNPGPGPPAARRDPACTARTTRGASQRVATSADHMHLLGQFTSVDSPHAPGEQAVSSKMGSRRLDGPPRSRGRAPRRTAPSLSAGAGTVFLLLGPKDDRLGPQGN